MKRLDLEKRKYFKNHFVLKQKGFELHHIIPLSWFEDENDFKLYKQFFSFKYSIIQMDPTYKKRNEISNEKKKKNEKKRKTNQ